MRWKWACFREASEGRSGDMTTCSDGIRFDILMAWDGIAKRERLTTRKEASCDEIYRELEQLAQRDELSP